MCKCLAIYTKFYYFYFVIYLFMIIGDFDQDIKALK